MVRWNPFGHELLYTNPFISVLMCPENNTLDTVTATLAAQGVKVTTKLVSTIGGSTVIKLTPENLALLGIKVGDQVMVMGLK